MQRASTTIAQYCYHLQVKKEDTSPFYRFKGPIITPPYNIKIISKKIPLGYLGMAQKEWPDENGEVSGLYY